MISNNNSSDSLIDAVSSNGVFDEKDMRVTKRSGSIEVVSFDKILKRIKTLGQEAGIKINYTSLVMKVIDQLYDKISTTKIDELSAEQCASMASIHPDYNILAGRIIVSNHHKNTVKSFTSIMKDLYGNKDIHGAKSPIISEELYNTVCSHGDEIDNMLQYERDYLIEYFGFKTLERAYLMKINNKVVERPQHMWMRVALGIHGNNLIKAKETYDLMSLKYFTHATPTLFNAGTPRPQMSSCYLLQLEDDSIEGIYNTLKDCALISKWAGGIGLHIHNVRAFGSRIRGTNGTSNGIVPMLRVFNNTAKYVDQCVHPETIIYTKNGPMEIQNCSSEETYVFNLKGEYEKIENILEHPYNGTVLNIMTYYSIENLIITPEHPIYVLRNQCKEISNSELSHLLEQNIASFEWVEAKELVKNDMLVHKIPTYNKDIGSITSDDCYMYGIILSNGCMQNNIEKSYIIINNRKTTTTKDFIINYFKNNCIDIIIEENNNNTIIYWNKNINLPFRYSDIYDSNKYKHISSKWLNLPIEKSKYILKGLINIDTIKNELIINNISRNLIEGIRFICMKMKVLTAGWSDEETEKSYIKIPLTEEMCNLLDIKMIEDSKFNYLVYKDYLLTPILYINQEEYTGTLYDLQMKDEHNYMLHNGIVHNGGGKRSGSFAIYLEPWHFDIEVFLQMRKNHGDEELKARDLFYALWIPDLFMERVKSGGKWTLMCPDECPGLSDVYGSKFVELYERYEKLGKGKKTIEARDLWFQILDSQMETGTPYLCYKDAANIKSNQQNVGTIKSSNLCTEIIEYSDSTETAVCNLASIALPSFVENGKFDYEKLHYITKVVTNNLNKVIDINFYPTPKTKKSNMRHRPIGIGVQGLSDVFMLMDLPFYCNESVQINKDIFETIYHAALEQSCENAMREGPYDTFSGSPASKRILQFDMWNVNPSDRYDWETLKDKIQKYGLRNSLLVAPMPTASTSQILGFNECIEPITSNIYSRRTLAGEFIIANKYLMNDMINLGLWNDKIKNNIILNNGSIQQLDMIPETIRNKYKTVWEMPMRNLIDMAADRGAYICQSQSLNLWVEDPNYNRLSSMHFYAWQKGLKTGIYYLRRRGAHKAQQFTIEVETKKKNIEQTEEICEMCSA